MTDTSKADPPPQTNGIDNDADEDERGKMRPADIDADMREMERRKRVEMIMNSRLFREELERIIEIQMKDGGNGPAGLLQQISDIMGGRIHPAGMFKSSNCVVPINDIRGVESMGYAKGEKHLRCKLAAVYRLIDLYGWAQGINNLITARLNQEEEHFIANPHGMLYHELTASSLVKLDMQGNVVESGTTNFPVNNEAFQLHAAVHAARPDIKCVIHVHTPSLLAVSSCLSGLLPISPEAVSIGECSYHPYFVSVDSEEKEKVGRSLGPINKVMFLANKGTLCCGETVEEAFFNAFNTIIAAETQLKLGPTASIDNVRVIPEEVRKPGSNKSAALQFEALMRMLDNAGFRTGYIYRQPLVKGELPRPRNDVEVPPAVSSLGYLLEEEEMYKQGQWKRYADGRKSHDRTRWLNSPNVYQKVEILETGTPDPKKITKWVDANAEEWVVDGSPTHSSTPVKIDCALQFVPKNTNPREFKSLQKQIKENRRADKITSGPQSHILEGVSWEEAKKLQDANVTDTGDQVIVVGAASKGIIQREYQHHATVYKTPYAKNPFDTVTDQELEDYKKVVTRKAKGEYSYDDSESEGFSSSAALPPSGRGFVSETEDDSRGEARVLRIETKQVPRASKAEVVLSDALTPAPVTSSSQPEENNNDTLVSTFVVKVLSTPPKMSPTFVSLPSEEIDNNDSSIIVEDYSKSMSRKIHLELSERFTESLSKLIGPYDSLVPKSSQLVKMCINNFGKTSESVNFENDSLSSSIQKDIFDSDDTLVSNPLSSEVLKDNLDADVQLNSSLISLCILKDSLDSDNVQLVSSSLSSGVKDSLDSDNAQLSSSFSSGVRKDSLDSDNLQIVSSSSVESLPIDFDSGLVKEDSDGMATFIAYSETVDCNSQPPLSPEKSIDKDDATLEDGDNSDSQLESNCPLCNKWCDHPKLGLSPCTTSSEACEKVPDDYLDIDFNIMSGESFNRMPTGSDSKDTDSSYLNFDIFEGEVDYPVIKAKCTMSATPQMPVSLPASKMPKLSTITEEGHIDDDMRDKEKDLTVICSTVSSSNDNHKSGSGSDDSPMFYEYYPFTDKISEQTINVTAFEDFVKETEDKHSLSLFSGNCVTSNPILIDKFGHDNERRETKSHPVLTSDVPSNLLSNIDSGAVLAVYKSDKIIHEMASDKESASFSFSSNPGYKFNSSGSKTHLEENLMQTSSGSGSDDCINETSSHESHSFRELKSECCVSFGRSQSCDDVKSFQDKEVDKNIPFEIIYEQKIEPTHARNAGKVYSSSGCKSSVISETDFGTKTLLSDNISHSCKPHVECSCVKSESEVENVSSDEKIDCGRNLIQLSHSCEIEYVSHTSDASISIKSSEELIPLSPAFSEIPCNYYQLSSNEPVFIADNRQSSTKLVFESDDDKQSPTKPLTVIDNHYQSITELIPVNDDKNQSLTKPTSVNNDLKQSSFELVTDSDDVNRSPTKPVSVDNDLKQSSAELDPITTDDNQSPTKIETVDNDLKQSSTESLTVSDDVSRLPTNPVSVNDDLKQSSAKLVPITTDDNQSPTKIETVDNDLQQSSTEPLTVSDDVSRSPTEPVSINDNLKQSSTEPLTVSDDVSHSPTEPVSVNDDLKQSSAKLVPITSDDNQSLSQIVPVDNDPTQSSTKSLTVSDDVSCLPAEPVSVNDELKQSSAKLVPVTTDDSQSPTKIVPVDNDFKQSSEPVRIKDDDKKLHTGSASVNDANQSSPTGQVISDSETPKQSSLKLSSKNNVAPVLIEPISDDHRLSLTEVAGNSLRQLLTELVFVSDKHGLSPFKDDDLLSGDNDLFISSACKLPKDFGENSFSSVMVVNSSPVTAFEELLFQKNRRESQPLSNSDRDEYRTVDSNLEFSEKLISTTGDSVCSKPSNDSISANVKSNNNTSDANNCQDINNIISTENSTNISDSLRYDSFIQYMNKNLASVALNISFLSEEVSSKKTSTPVPVNISAARVQQLQDNDHKTKNSSVTQSDSSSENKIENVVLSTLMPTSHGNKILTTEISQDILSAKNCVGEFVSAASVPSIPSQENRETISVSSTTHKLPSSDSTIVIPELTNLEQVISESNLNICTSSLNVDKDCRRHEQSETQVLYKTCSNLSCEDSSKIQIPNSTPSVDIKAKKMEGLNHAENMLNDQNSDVSGEEEIIANDVDISTQVSSSKDSLSEAVIKKSLNVQLAEELFLSCLPEELNIVLADIPSKSNRDIQEENKMKMNLVGRRADSKQSSNSSHSTDLENAKRVISDSSQEKLNPDSLSENTYSVNLLSDESAENLSLAVCPSAVVENQVQPKMPSEISVIDLQSTSGRVIPSLDDLEKPNEVCRKTATNNPSPTESSMDLVQSVRLSESTEYCDFSEIPSKESVVTDNFQNVTDTVVSLKNDPDETQSLKISSHTGVSHFSSPGSLEKHDSPECLQYSEKSSQVEVNGLESSEQILSDHPAEELGNVLLEQVEEQISNCSFVRDSEVSDYFTPELFKEQDLIDISEDETDIVMVEESPEEQASLNCFAEDPENQSHFSHGLFEEQSLMDSSEDKTDDILVKKSLEKQFPSDSFKEDSEIQDYFSSTLSEEKNLTENSEGEVSVVLSEKSLEELTSNIGSQEDSGNQDYYSSEFFEEQNLTDSLEDEVGSILTEESPEEQILSCSCEENSENQYNSINESCIEQNFTYYSEDEPGNVLEEDSAEEQKSNNSSGENLVNPDYFSPELSEENNLTDTYGGKIDTAVEGKSCEKQIPKSSSEENSENLDNFSSTLFEGQKSAISFKSGDVITAKSPKERTSNSSFKEDSDDASQESFEELSTADYSGDESGAALEKESPEKRIPNSSTDEDSGKQDRVSSELREDQNSTVYSENKSGAVFVNKLPEEQISNWNYEEDSEFDDYFTPEMFDEQFSDLNSEEEKYSSQRKKLGMHTVCKSNDTISSSDRYCSIVDKSSVAFLVDADAVSKIDSTNTYGAKINIDVGQFSLNEKSNENIVATHINQQVLDPNLANVISVRTDIFAGGRNRELEPNDETSVIDEMQENFSSDPTVKRPLLIGNLDQETVELETKIVKESLEPDFDFCAKTAEFVISSDFVVAEVLEKISAELDTIPSALSDTLNIKREKDDVLGDEKVDTFIQVEENFMPLDSTTQEVEVTANLHSQYEKIGLDLLPVPNEATPVLESNFGEGSKKTEMKQYDPQEMKFFNIEAGKIKPDLDTFRLVKKEERTSPIPNVDLTVDMNFDNEKKICGLFAQESPQETGLSLDEMESCFLRPESKTSSLDFVDFKETECFGKNSSLGPDSGFKSAADLKPVNECISEVMAFIENILSDTEIGSVDSQEVVSACTRIISDCQKTSKQEHFPEDFLSDSKMSSVGSQETVLASNIIKSEGSKASDKVQSIEGTLSDDESGPLNSNEMVAISDMIKSEGKEASDRVKSMEDCSAFDKMSSIDSQKFLSACNTVTSDGWRTPDHVGSREDGSSVNESDLVESKNSEYPCDGIVFHFHDTPDFNHSNESAVIKSRECDVMLSECQNVVNVVQSVPDSSSDCVLDVFSPPEINFSYSTKLSDCMCAPVNNQSVIDIVSDTESDIISRQDIIPHSDLTISHGKITSSHGYDQFVGNVSFDREKNINSIEITSSCNEVTSDCQNNSADVNSVVDVTLGSESISSHDIAFSCDAALFDTHNASGHVQSVTDNTSDNDSNIINLQQFALACDGILSSSQNLPSLVQSVIDITSDSESNIISPHEIASSLNVNIFNHANVPDQVQSVTDKMAPHDEVANNYQNFSNLTQSVIDISSDNESIIISMPDIVPCDGATSNRPDTPDHSQSITDIPLDNICNIISSEEITSSSDFVMSDCQNSPDLVQSVMDVTMDNECHISPHKIVSSCDEIVSDCTQPVVDITLDKESLFCSPHDIASSCDVIMSAFQKSPDRVQSVMSVTSNDECNTSPHKIISSCDVVMFDCRNSPDYAQSAMDLTSGNESNISPHAIASSCNVVMFDCQSSYDHVQSVTDVTSDNERNISVHKITSCDIILSDHQNYFNQVHSVMDTASDNGGNVSPHEIAFIPKATLTDHQKAADHIPSVINLTCDRKSKTISLGDSASSHDAIMSNHQNSSVCIQSVVDSTSDDESNNNRPPKISVLRDVLTSDRQNAPEPLSSVINVSDNKESISDWQENTSSYNAIMSDHQNSSGHTQSVIDIASDNESSICILHEVTSSHEAILSGCQDAPYHVQSDLDILSDDSSNISSRRYIESSHGAIMLNCRNDPVPSLSDVKPNDETAILNCQVPDRTLFLDATSKEITNISQQDTFEFSNTKINMVESKESTTSHSMIGSEVESQSCAQSEIFTTDFDAATINQSANETDLSDSPGGSSDDSNDDSSGVFNSIEGDQNDSAANLTESEADILHELTDLNSIELNKNDLNIFQVHIHGKETPRRKSPSKSHGKAVGPGEVIFNRKYSRRRHQRLLESFFGVEEMHTDNQKSSKVEAVKCDNYASEQLNFASFSTQTADFNKKVNFINLSKPSNQSSANSGAISSKSVINITNQTSTSRNSDKTHCSNCGTSDLLNNTENKLFDIRGKDKNIFDSRVIVDTKHSSLSQPCGRVNQFIKSDMMGNLRNQKSKRLVHFDDKEILSGLNPEIIPSEFRSKSSHSKKSTIKQKNLTQNKQAAGLKIAGSFINTVSSKLVEESESDSNERWLHFCKNLEQNQDFFKSVPPCDNFNLGERQHLTIEYLESCFSDAEDDENLSNSNCVVVENQQSIESKVCAVEDDQSVTLEEGVTGNISFSQENGRQSDYECQSVSEESESRTDESETEESEEPSVKPEMDDFDVRINTRIRIKQNLDDSYNLDFQHNLCTSTGKNEDRQVKNLKMLNKPDSSSEIESSQTETESVFDVVKVDAKNDRVKVLDSVVTDSGIEESHHSSKKNQKVIKSEEYDSNQTLKGKFHGKMKSNSKVTFLKSDGNMQNDDALSVFEASKKGCCTSHENKDFYLNQCKNNVGKVDTWTTDRSKVNESLSTGEGAIFSGYPDTEHIVTVQFTGPDMSSGLASASDFIKKVGGKLRTKGKDSSDSESGSSEKDPEKKRRIKAGGSVLSSEEKTDKFSAAGAKDGMISSASEDIDSYLNVETSSSLSNFSEVWDTPPTSFVESENDVNKITTNNNKETACKANVSDDMLKDSSKLKAKFPLNKVMKTFNTKSTYYPLKRKNVRLINDSKCSSFAKESVVPKHGSKRTDSPKVSKPRNISPRFRQKNKHETTVSASPHLSNSLEEYRDLELNCVLSSVIEPLNKLDSQSS